MEHRYEQALRLYIQKLTGDLSAAEECYVRKMLAGDAAFRKIWSSLEKESNTKYLRKVNPEADLQEWKERQIRKPLPWVKIAVAAGILVAAAYCLYRITSK